ncbi:translation initiation factor IF-2-like [Acinonyx jubatus]|uniref:Translation initiation factor IF-2-like n=1 Tax=Acinonyx jubatus TaxID=32536 RepID=A0ABM3P801_ACIJB|nr:translation initiation factor IF-2-like [Acinonyx jubatus]
MFGRRAPSLRTEPTGERGAAPHPPRGPRPRASWATRRHHAARSKPVCSQPPTAAAQRFLQPTGRCERPGTAAEEAGKRVPRFGPARGARTRPGAGEGDVAGRENLPTRTDGHGGTRASARPAWFRGGPGGPSRARNRGGPRERRANPRGFPGGRHVTEGVPRGSAGGRGRSRGGWLPGRAEPRAPGPPGRLPPRCPAPPRPPLTYLPRSSAHRRPRTGRPQAARRHDGCSACLFKSGSLSPRSAQAQRSGPKALCCWLLSLLATCGYQALEAWPVQIETCCKRKIHTDFKDVLPNNKGL